MTEQDFNKFKTNLNNKRALSATEGKCMGIDIEFHLTNGEVIKVSSSKLLPTDTADRPEWETQSPTLTDGMVTAYDYPTEVVENPDAITNVTTGNKTEYVFPLDAIFYIKTNWVRRKVVAVESGSTANVGEE